MIYGNTIEEAGYFSREAEAFTELLSNEDKAYFEIFGEITRLAFRTLVRLRFGTKEFRKIYAVCLFSRLLESCQATTFLAHRGFGQDTAVLVRVALEAYLKLVVACTKPDLAQKIVNSDLIEQGKLVNVVLQGWAGEVTPEKRLELEARKREIEEQRREHSIHDVPTIQIAQGADQEGLYQNTYRLTSKYVHISPRALEEYMNKDERGEIVGLQLGPSDRFIPVHVFSVSEFLLMGIGVIEDLFGLTSDPEAENVASKFRRLKPSWPGESVEESVEEAKRAEPDLLSEAEKEA